MNLLRRLAVLLVSIFVLVACANMETVTKAPRNEGVSRTYSEDYELVKAAVLGSMQSLNVNIKDTTETPNEFSVTFTKSISAFSWGEVGRVLVLKNSSGSSEVLVHSEKRSKYQITGADEREFANRIFSGVSEILEKDKK